MDENLEFRISRISDQRIRKGLKEYWTAAYYLQVQEMNPRENNYSHGTVNIVASTYADDCLRKIIGRYEVKKHDRTNSE